MQMKIVPEIDKLYQDVKDYKSSKSFRSLIHFVSKFPHMAPYNAMLVYIQKPGSTYVASARDWYDKFGRKIKPGARPLLILRPFGPVSFVYEYNDTEGNPLPVELVAPFKTKDTVSNSKLKTLINNIRADGVHVEFSNFGTSMAAFIRREEQFRFVNMHLGESSKRVRSYYSIVVNSNLSDTEAYASILHELGHMYCGHLNSDFCRIKWLPARGNIGLTDEQIEFEAETVCYLVCERLGIKNPSVEYLAGYLNNNGEIPDVSIDCIMKAAGTIESFTRGYHRPRKELVIK